jgi:serine/threonine protein kinase
VYALGTVLWEVLSAQLPFDGEFPATIRRKIVSGYTHPIPAQYANTAVADLVQSCWAFDPNARPTSKEVASTLEVMLKDQCYKHISGIESIPDTAVLRNFYDQHYRKSVYGDSQLHKFLFADLQEPSLLQYINPVNWFRYLYSVYSTPRYRGLSVDDSDDGSVESSSLSGSRLGGASEGRDSMHRRLFDAAEDNDADASESGAPSRSSYVMSEDRNHGAVPMYAQLPRAALDVIGVIKVRFWNVHAGTIVDLVVHKGGALCYE